MSDELREAEEDLRRFFMERGWAITLDDRPGQSLHPFYDLAAALRPLIIEAKAQARAALAADDSPSEGLDDITARRFTRWFLMQPRGKQAEFIRGVVEGPPGLTDLVRLADRTDPSRG